MSAPDKYNPDLVFNEYQIRKRVEALEGAAKRGSQAAGQLLSVYKQQLEAGKDKEIPRELLHQASLDVGEFDADEESFLDQVSALMAARPAAPSVKISQRKTPIGSEPDLAARDRPIREREKMLKGRSNDALMQSEMAIYGLDASKLKSGNSRPDLDPGSRGSQASQSRVSISGPVGGGSPFAATKASSPTPSPGPSSAKRLPVGGHGPGANPSSRLLGVSVAQPGGSKRDSSGAGYSGFSGSPTTPSAMQSPPGSAASGSPSPGAPLPQLNMRSALAGPSTAHLAVGGAAGRAGAVARARTLLDASRMSAGSGTPPPGGVAAARPPATGGATR